MDISVIGTGFIGGTLGRAIARRGHTVTFGSRHPDDDEVAADSPARVASISEALAAADVTILAVPGAAVEQLRTEQAAALSGKLVIDATNQMGTAVANGRSALPDTVRYARAFNTLGGENMADPVFADGPADMFFSAPTADRSTRRGGDRGGRIASRLRRRERRSDHRLPVPSVGRFGHEAGTGSTARLAPPRGLRS